MRAPRGGSVFIYQISHSTLGLYVLFDSVYVCVRLFLSLERAPRRVVYPARTHSLDSFDRDKCSMISPMHSLWFRLFV